MRRPSALVSPCWSGSPAAAETTGRPRARQATAATTAAPARAPGPDCGQGVRSHAIRFATRDGLSLAGAVVGSGPVGAVLIHEYPLDFCGWWPYARYLSRRGVHALVSTCAASEAHRAPKGAGTRSP